MSCHTRTRKRAHALAALVEGGTQRRHLSVHAHKHPHPQPPSHAHTRVQTHTAGETRAHTSVDRGDTASPGTPTTDGLVQEEGLLRARLPPDSFQRMFPYLACQVSGERASEMQQEPLGGQLELTVPCLALPANSLTEKLFVARARVAGEPPATSPRVPSPRRLPAALGRPRAAVPLPSAREPGLPACLAAYLRCLDSEGWKGRRFCPRRVNRQTPGRRTISVLSVQECGSRGGGGGGGGRAAAAWAVGRQGSPEGAPSPLRSSRSVREPSRTQRGELEEKKRQKRERKRKRERE